MTTMDHPDDRDDDAAPRRRAPWARIGLVAAVGVAGFGITAAARSGTADQAGQTPDTTSTTSTTSVPAQPLVVEVPMPILAPITGPGLPVIDPAYEGDDIDDFPTSVTQILSPVVGQALVPSGGGTDASSWTPAPPEFAPQLELSVTEPDTDPDAAPDIDDMYDPIEIPAGALDDVFHAGAADLAVDPVLGEPLVVDDDGIGFVDPCTATEDETCPDPGEPATVGRLFGQQIPPPLTVTVTANPTGECAADVADTELRIAVESTAPLQSMDLDYWAQIRSMVSPSVEVLTPEATTAAWLTAFEEAAIDGPPPPPILHCLTLTGIFSRDAVGYRYRIDAVDVFDQIYVTTTSSWSAPVFTAARERPPTLVWPLNDNEVVVSVPHRADQFVGILAFRDTGESGAADPCHVPHPRQSGYDTAIAPLDPMRSTVSVGELLSAGYKAAYVHRTAGAMRLAEGSRYRICVYWSVTVPSFDAGVERSEGYDIITPDALDTSFSIVDFDIDGTDRAGLDPGDLRISVAPISRGLLATWPGCGSWTNQYGIERSATIDSLICDVDPRSTALYRRGAIVEIRARDIDGVDQTSRHVLRTASCTGLCIPPDSDYFRVELPTGAPERDFWCGGVGDACDRPTDRSYGTVLIRVDYDNTRGDASGAWSVSDPIEIANTRPPTPEFPQLDTTQRPTASGPARGRTVTLPVIADRQVSMQAELLTTAGEPACVGEGGNTTAGTEYFTKDRTFTFTEVCPGQTLLPVVTLTERDGTSSTWHAAQGYPGFPEDAQRWTRGAVLINPLEWTFDTDLELTLPTSYYRLQALGVSLYGLETTDEHWYPITPRPSTRGCTGTGSPLETRALSSDLRSPRRAITYDDLRITIVVDVELLLPSCIQPTTTFEQPGRQVLRLDVPLDSVDVGESFVLEAAIPVPGLPDPDATLDIRGTITIVSGS